MARRTFDLVIATNVFVYYDVLEQALAMANVEAMLKPGAFLLANFAAPQAEVAHHPSGRDADDPVRARPGRQREHPRLHRLVQGARQLSHAGQVSGSSGWAALAVLVVVVACSCCGRRRRPQPQTAGRCRRRTRGSPIDAVARLQQKIDGGEVTLTFDRDHGYLELPAGEPEHPGLVAAAGLLEVERADVRHLAVAAARHLFQR